MTEEEFRAEFDKVIPCIFRHRREAFSAERWRDEVASNVFKLSVPALKHIYKCGTCCGCHNWSPEVTSKVKTLLKEIEQVDDIILGVPADDSP